MHAPADLLLFTATANTSIISLNLSLMINTVGFYQARFTLQSALPMGQALPVCLLAAGHIECHVCAQIAKLLIIPFVCLVEAFWLGKVFTRSIIGSVLTVVAGVAIV